MTRFLGCSQFSDKPSLGELIERYPEASNGYFLIATTRNFREDRRAVGIIAETRDGDHQDFIGTGEEFHGESSILKTEGYGQFKIAVFIRQKTTFPAIDRRRVGRDRNGILRGRKPHDPQPAVSPVFIILIV